MAVETVEMAAVEMVVEEVSEAEPEEVEVKREKEAGKAAPRRLHAAGFKLHLSDRNATGYQSVYKNGKKFAANMTSPSGKVNLGQHATAVDAAVAVARHLQSKNLAAAAEQGKAAAKRAKEACAPAAAKAQKKIKRKKMNW